MLLDFLIFFVIGCGSGWPLLIMIYIIIIIIIMFLSIVYAAAGSNVKSVRSRLSFTERDVVEGGMRARGPTARAATMFFFCFDLLQCFSACFLFLFVFFLLLPLQLRTTSRGGVAFISA